MEKTLIPFDGSASALRALQFFVKQVADGKAAEAHLLNVQLPIRLNSAPIASAESLQQSQEAEGARVLQAACDELDKANIRYSSKVLIGDVATSIARYASEQGCGEVIMGTRGMGSIANLVLGSVATKVIHAVHIPVTLVK